MAKEARERNAVRRQSETSIRLGQAIADYAAEHGITEAAGRLSKDSADLYAQATRRPVAREAADALFPRRAA
jgi:hypothetical protein